MTGTIDIHVHANTKDNVWRTKQCSTIRRLSHYRIA